MATKAELRNRALHLVGVGDRYNAIDADTASEADAFFTDLHEEWINRELVDWELTNIPVRANRPTVYLLAFALTDLYPVSDSTFQRLSLMAASAEQRLKEQMAIPYNGEPVEFSSF